MIFLGGFFYRFLSRRETIRSSRIFGFYIPIRVALTHILPLSPSRFHSAENIARSFTRLFSVSSLRALKTLRVSIYVSFRIIRSFILPFAYFPLSPFQSPSRYTRHASPVINQCPLPAHLLVFFSHLLLPLHLLAISFLL